MANEGQIFVENKLLFDASNEVMLSDSQIRRNRLHFGLVFQSFNLFPQYTVLQNLTLAPTLALGEELRERRKCEGRTSAKTWYGAAVAEITEKAEAILGRVGLSEKKDSYPCELSGGQQQRVAIARALCMAPHILCFDEPTSALDPELTGEVLRVIKELKSGERTMVIVTHEMDFARHVSDKVMFMADGVIEEMGTPEEIFDHPQSPKLKAFLDKDKNLFS
jgi:polar amino acid transport system ATP-binding protein